LAYHDKAFQLNIGTGEDITIAELAETICEVVGYKGKIGFDPSKPKSFWM
jgi:GDP-L-fucose synthase